VILNAGNVGIGTTSPQALLESYAGTGGTSSIAGLIYGSTDTGTFTDPGISSPDGCNAHSGK